MSRNKRLGPAALVRLIALIGLVAGCGERAIAPVKPLAGTYALVAVNHAPLPTADTLDGQLRTFMSGALTVTDSTYLYSACVDSTGYVDAVCGGDRYAVTDSGRIWWSPAGASFVGTTSHISRALVVNLDRDSLTFNANDLATIRFTFVR